eukprot:1457038-Pyramimonas_sp.AAC.1
MAGYVGPCTIDASPGYLRGVAVLTRKVITITAAPGTDGGVLVPHQLLATRVHWGIRKGIIIYSMYLYVGDKMSARNVEILRRFAEHANETRRAGFLWVLGAGYNMTTEEM